MSDSRSVGSSAAEVLWRMMPEASNLGCHGLAPNDGIEEVKSKVAGLESEDDKQASALLLRVVERSGSFGEATLPDGMGTVLLVDGSSDGNNTVLNIATARWYFRFEQNYYG